MSFLRAGETLHPAATRRRQGDSPAERAALLRAEVEDAGDDATPMLLARAEQAEAEADLSRSVGVKVGAAGMDDGGSWSGPLRPTSLQGTGPGSVFAFVGETQNEP